MRSSPIPHPDSPPAADSTHPLRGSLQTKATREHLLSQLHLAFALMSVIPLLLCCYLITVKFFTLAILEGVNGLYFLGAILVALLGLFVGRLLIRHVVQQLVDANTKLQSFHETQATFVNNVAHEFRTPLTIVKGAMDNLMDGLHGKLSDSQREQTNMCRQEISHLSGLVQDLLDVSQIEAGKLRLTREDVVLNDCLRSIAQSFEVLLKAHSLRLSVELPDDPVTITGDPNRLTQVFVNLISNAIKFTERGTIILRLTPDAQTVQIEIIDTGPGIPSEDLQRIFDKFERVGSRTQQGSGLGLPIAKSIVELHQGRLRVESRLGHGSRFIVSLPRTK